MTIRQTLNQATKKLSKSTSPALDAEVLLSHVLDKPKEYLYLNPDKYLLRSMLRNYSKLVNLRTQGMPVAYLTNQKEFFGLNFYVDKNVLVPRPETEGLVELALKYIFKYIHKQPLKILDIGTGSGNIIITLAKTLWSNSHELDHNYFASDVSLAALKVAKQNAKAHKILVSFKQSDLLQAWKNQNFDVIIANLPYGWKQWKNNTSANTIGLKFEPQEALFTTNNGLALYEKLLKQIASRVIPAKAGIQKKSSISGSPIKSGMTHEPCFIFIEFDPRQTKALKKLANKLLPAYEIKIFKDLAGWNRYVVLEKKSS